MKLILTIGLEVSSKDAGEVIAAKVKDALQNENNVTINGRVIDTVDADAANPNP